MKESQNSPFTSVSQGKNNQNTIYSHSAARPDQNVRETSQDAYAEHIASGKNHTETQITFHVLLKLGKANRKMLSRATGYEINKITEYVKQVLLSGKAIELPIKEKCPISNRNTFFLVPNPNEYLKQGKLFSDG